jgi:hypothetical protein
MERKAFISYYDVHEFISSQQLGSPAELFSSYSTHRQNAILQCTIRLVSPSIFRIILRVAEFGRAAVVVSSFYYSM